MRLAGVLLAVVVVVLAGCADPTDSTGAPTDSPATADEPERPATASARSSAGVRSASPTPTVTRSAAGTETPTETPAPPTVTFVVDGERRATVAVEVAHTPRERRKGLMGRRSLAPDRGMLFLYPDEAPRTFWMKDTYVPLDVVFVDANGTVLNVEHASPQPNVTDDELRRYRSAGPAKYVVEVSRGFANRTGVGPGAEVRLRLNRSTDSS